MAGLDDLPIRDAWISGCKTGTNPFTTFHGVGRLLHCKRPTAEIEGAFLDALPIPGRYRIDSRKQQGFHVPGW